MRSEGERAAEDLLLDEMCDRIWTTRDGQDIAYEDLKDSHLLNIIAMLQRQSSAVTLGLMIVNGEQAGYALEAESGRIEQELDELLSECDRRGWSRQYSLSRGQSK